MGKKDKSTATAAPMPNTMMYSQPAYSQPGMMPPTSAAGMPPTGMPNTMPNTMPGKKAKKGKKDKDISVAIPKPTAMQEELMAQMSPEQLQQMQMEEAIKESQNPSMRLRKLKSPLSVKGCLLNILFLVVLTIIAVFAVIAIFYVDRFNLGVIFRSMMQEFKIYDFFQMVGGWFSGLFSGCGN
ncbi:MAG: hypothetical protein FWH03_07770 [Firmicutes bacterium]|nr:hypothetical protein [Bacillota bacterium]